jgi:2'-5' RNA ligase
MAANLETPQGAIVVPVEIPVALRRLRDRLDPAAAVGVAAHITLLFPFMAPREVDAAVRETVGRVVSLEPAFPFVLARVEHWPSVVYLPPEPAEPFSRLIDRLIAAFPEFPPYGGAHAQVVPHLTICQSDRADYLDAATHALPGLLPVRAFAREVSIIGHEPGQHWSTLWKRPLGDG